MQKNACGVLLFCSYSCIQIKLKQHQDAKSGFLQKKKKVWIGTSQKAIYKITRKSLQYHWSLCQLSVYCHSAPNSAFSIGPVMIGLVPLNAVSFKVSTVLTFLSRGRWRTIAGRKGSPIVSWCWKACGRTPSAALPQPPALGVWIHGDLPVSARTDDYLSMALNRETGTQSPAGTRPLTPFAAPVCPPEIQRVSHCCCCLSGQVWRGAWRVPTLCMPLYWELIACSLLAVRGLLCAHQFFRSALAWTNPAVFSLSSEWDKLHIPSPRFEPEPWGESPFASLSFLGYSVSILGYHTAFSYLL